MIRPHIGSTNKRGKIRTLGRWIIERYQNHREAKADKIQQREGAPMPAQLNSSLDSHIQYGSLGDTVTSCITVTVAISSETRNHLPGTQDSASFFSIQLGWPQLSWGWA